VTARLHHERIARSDASPERWLLLTHGIFGTGANWRGIARKVTEQRREWGIVLVDLRLHGRSEDGTPPHTVEACAEDLRALVTELGDIAAIAGHSLGGKICAAARPRLQLQQTWLLDSSPSPRPGALEDPSNSVLRVLGDLERLPRTWEKREQMIAALVERGHTTALAQWLAMSVNPDAAGTLTLRFDLAALRELLADYFATDQWASLDDPTLGAVELVIGDKSSVFTDDDQLRLARADRHVRAHHVNAGHWLHIEAQAEVVELFSQFLV
jgi:esterase